MYKKNYTTCKLHNKATPIPVVGFPMATQLQTIVPMDLKKERSYINLLIIALNHLSAFIVNKNSDTIITSIFKIWIPVYDSQ